MTDALRMDATASPWLWPTPTLLTESGRLLVPVEMLYGRLGRQVISIEASTRTLILSEVLWHRLNSGSSEPDSSQKDPDQTSQDYSALTEGCLCLSRPRRQEASTFESIGGCIDGEN